MEKKEFTIEEGIKYQTEQLVQWKTVLIPEVYAALEEYATRNNHEAKSGHGIRRGVDLSSYISNYMLGHRY
jgi:hypothetical protein